MNQEQKKPMNVWRIIFSAAYFLIFALLLLIFWTKMVYLDPPKNSWNLCRFVWCLAFTAFGFSSIAFCHRRNPKTPFPEYVAQYPFQLGAMAALVFSILHIFQSTSGYVFYYLSSSVCFTLGFLVDEYFGMFKSIVSKVSG